jgi:tetratricopeptide (TPR) repeat protein
LTLLDERAERGNAHLVLARALLEQERDDEAEGELDAADLLFALLGSASHIAAAWVVRGDACCRRGDFQRAATLYRRAAARLQDFHF